MKQFKDLYIPLFPVPVYDGINGLHPRHTQISLCSATFNGIGNSGNKCVGIRCSQCLFFNANEKFFKEWQKNEMRNKKLERICQ